ncbi:MAG: NAD(P)H-hydrate dehydratase [Rubrivivax sp.]|nr:NAD(P)H-hydrate dehydratase [Rubrivivax sp.]
MLDADALNLLAERPGLLELRRGPLLLTPHPGEAARLTELPISVLESDRYASAAGLARRFNATVILKGARSMVAAPDGRLAVNPTGCPAMASGGMGDALTGLLAALLAQGLGTFESACAAAWLHGRAGEIAAAGADAGLLASDLIEALPAARRELREPPAPARR